MLEMTFRGERGDGDRISPGVDGCSRGNGKRCVGRVVHEDGLFFSLVVSLILQKIANVL